MTYVSINSLFFGILIFNALISKYPDVLQTIVEDSYGYTGINKHV